MKTTRRTPEVVATILARACVPVERMLVQRMLAVINR
jgi:hypothetical protein